MTDVWILGESDDYLEAVFTSEERARAYATAKGIDFDNHKNFWWIEKVALDPAAEEGTP